MTSILGRTGSSLGTHPAYEVAAKPTNTRELEVEQTIKAEVWKRQIRMKYFFEDFDKLRKGFCTEDKVSLRLCSSALVCRSPFTS